MKKFFKAIDYILLLIAVIATIYNIYKGNTLESLWWMGIIIWQRVDTIIDKLEENANSSQNTINK